jgi:hypothetical protein
LLIASRLALTAAVDASKWRPVLGQSDARERAPLRRGGGASGYIDPARLRKVFVRRAKSISIWAQKKWHVDGFLIVRKVGIGFRNFV